MKSQSIPLTRDEAAEIAQRAFVERLVERPGIWTMLQTHVRPARKRVKASMQPRLLKLSV